MCVCVRACVRAPACVRACMNVCVRAHARARVLIYDVACLFCDEAVDPLYCVLDQFQWCRGSSVVQSEQRFRCSHLFCLFLFFSCVSKVVQPFLSFDLCTRNVLVRIFTCFIFGEQMIGVNCSSAKQRQPLYCTAQFCCILYCLTLQFIVLSCYSLDSALS